MKTTLLSTAISLSLAILSTHIHAENAERWFQVEVLIFTNPSLEADNPEQWPSFPSIKHPANFIKLQGLPTTGDASPASEHIDTVNIGTSQPDISLSEERPTADTPFYVLTAQERTLTKQRQILEQNRRHRILFHEAWTQPVPGRDLVVPIRIEAGNTFGRQSELQGYISLYVERFLHFSADLHLLEFTETSDPFSVYALTLPNREPESLTHTHKLSLQVPLERTPFNMPNTARFFVSTQSASLQENRRMRSGTLHYLDNPLFGLLITITPLDAK